MNWLEIGCPYCPTLLTVPRTAAGRNVRCPECGKTYIVPEPNLASTTYDATTPLPPASMEAVKFEEVAAAVASPAEVAVARHPLPPTGTTANAASVAPPVESLAAAPAMPRPRRRVSSDDLMYPELERDSPLPELELLPPPGWYPAKPKRPASSQAANVAVAKHPAAPPGSDAHDPRTSTAAEPPYGAAPYGPSQPTRSAAEETAAMEEVQERIRRNRQKALINLATFVVGIVVMTAFAFLVVRFSRPS